MDLPVRAERCAEPPNDACDWPADRGDALERPDICEICCAQRSRWPRSVTASGVPIGNSTCTKISPRSTRGMNSNPTSPSGISATATQRQTERDADDDVRVAQAPTPARAST